MYPHSFLYIGVCPPPHLPFFRWGGGGGVRLWGGGGQVGCELKSEVFCENSKKKISFFFWGGGGGRAGGGSDQGLGWERVARFGVGG